MGPFFRRKNPVLGCTLVCRRRRCRVQFHSHSEAVRFSCFTFFGCKINVWAIAWKQTHRTKTGKDEAKKENFAIIFCTFIKSSRCFMYVHRSGEYLFLSSSLLLLMLRSLLLPLPMALPLTLLSLRICCSRKLLNEISFQSHFETQNAFGWCSKIGVLCFFSPIVLFILKYHSFTRVYLVERKHWHSLWFCVVQKYVYDRC